MKKNIIKIIFALSITTISLVSCVSDNDYKTPPFPFYSLNFEKSEYVTGVAANVPNTINKNLTSTPLWEVRQYNKNKYIQFSSYYSQANTVDNAWFILPEVEVIPSQKISMSFYLAQAVPVGTFPLSVYYSTNFDGNSDHIEAATWTLMPINFSASTGNYTFVKMKGLNYQNEDVNTQKVYFAFNYKGEKTNGTTTTIQVDDINLTFN